MELKANRIPPEFAQTIPTGMRLVKRGENEFLLVTSLFCPKGHSLLVDSVRIHEEASIKVKVSIASQNGLVFIDSFWGSHAKLFSIIPKLTTEEVYVEAFCPQCDIPMIQDYSCSEKECNSTKALVLYLPGGKNLIHVCAKLGCPGHELKISDMPLELIESVSQINFFGEGADTIFGGI